MVDQEQQALALVLEPLLLPLIGKFSHRFQHMSRRPSWFWFHKDGSEGTTVGGGGEGGAMTWKDRKSTFIKFSSIANDVFLVSGL